MVVVPHLARRGSRFLLVENVVVDAGHRRRGIGRRLLTAASEIARQHGCYKLQLSADSDEAFAFYESIGLRAEACTYKLRFGGEPPAPPQPA